MTAARGSFGTDYQAFELLIASCVALSIPVWLAVLLSFSQLDVTADAPEIGGGDEIAVKVKPVVDLDHPLLRKGGPRVKYKIPDMWKEAAPRPEPTDAPRRQAHVSDKAKDDVEDIPDPDLEVSDAGVAPDPDAAVSDDPDASTDIPDEPDASADNTGNAGGGDPEGSEFGTSTVLKNRAAQIYKGRITSFLYAGWPGTCPPGTPPECRGTVSYNISGLTVSSVSPSGCGSAAFDAQVASHAQGKVGQSIPPPPENYPELAPSNFTVTYACK